MEDDPAPSAAVLDALRVLAASRRLERPFTIPELVRALDTTRDALDPLLAEAEEVVPPLIRLRLDRRSGRRYVELTVAGELVLRRASRSARER